MITFAMKSHPLVSLLCVASLVASVAGCHGGSPSEKADTAAVAKWNQLATDAVVKFNANDAAGGIPPMIESRMYAMAFSAAHDALNAIDARYQPYLTRGTSANASPDAAVAAAIHDVMVSQLPPLQADLDAAYNTALAAITEGESKTNGIALGKQMAAAITASRQSDGSASAQTPYVPGTAPGNYRFTAPFNGPPFNGFVALPAWGKVKTFVATSGAQFRSPPPYQVTDAAYTKDFNEIKSLGAANGSLRTSEQSEIGRFWLESSPLGWNRIAATLAKSRNLNGWDQARVFALVHLAVADSYISSFDSKYFYNFWRPVTAVNLADTDGNPDTTGDATWSSFDPVTPPLPDYPSAHASSGGAAAAVLRGVFASDDIAFSQTSTTLPGVTRSYTKLSQAALENNASRIYVGYHFRLAVDEGLKLGDQLGKLAVQSRLQPL